MTKHQLWLSHHDFLSRLHMWTEIAHRRGLNVTDHRYREGMDEAHFILTADLPVEFVDGYDLSMLPLAVRLRAICSVPYLRSTLRYAGCGLPYDQLPPTCSQLRGPLLHWHLLDLGWSTYATIPFKRHCSSLDIYDVLRKAVSPLPQSLSQSGSLPTYLT